jgi:pilus assembly protein CpaD
MKITSKFLPRSSALGLMCFAAMALSACITDEAALDDSLETPAYGGSDAYPITVAKGPVTLEVSSRQGTLQPGQVNAVQGFVHQAASAGVTPVTINRPSGGGASARVASEIAALMTQQGIQRNMIRVATYPAPASGKVVLSYVSTYAQTKPCGEWPDDATENDFNRHFASHGCAVQANIAAMVANPETLVVPTTVDPIRAAGRVAAIKKLENPIVPRYSFFSFY